ncbi:MAG: hypothetical protein ACKPBU_15655, partial [Alphaproteobacteria bacterium]
LKAYAAELQNLLRRIPGIVDLEVSLEQDVPEYRLIVDRKRAVDAGLMTADVVRTVGALVGGQAVTTYEDEMPFLPAIVMVDMQLVHATKASLPSPRFPGEQGWYFNQGSKSGTTPEWFTVAAMIAASH